MPIIDDWSYVGNRQFGVVSQIDSQLVDAARSQRKGVFASIQFLAPLQLSSTTGCTRAYATGPSYMNFRYRYAITSRQGPLSDAGAARFWERMVTPVLAR